MRARVSLAIVGAALLTVASCATTPPAKPPVEAPQPEKPAVAAPDPDLAQAKALQEKVDGYGLGQYDPDDYAAATKGLKAGQDSYGKDNAAAKQSLQAAITAFKAVIAKGGPVLVAKAQDQTLASKKAADDLKASVAVNVDYTKADGVYQNALKEKDAGDFEKAVSDFGSARDMFDAVARLAQQKRDAAMLSLQAAQQDRGASERKAAEAQKALQDEGITISSSGQ